MAHLKDYKTEDIDTVIESYQLAQKQQSSARTVIGIITLFILGVYIGLIWNSLNNFKHTKLPDLSQEITFNTNILSDIMFKHLGTSLNYLAPTYTKAYQETFLRDKSIYGDVIAEEFRKLELYLKKTSPAIDENINGILESQEQALISQLKPYFSKSQQALIASTYKERLKNNLYTLKLNDDSFNLSLQESSIQRPIIQSDKEHFMTSSQYSVGLFLELLGLEMQIKSKAI